MNRLFPIAIVIALVTAPAEAQQSSNTCYFLVGPTAGTTRYFSGYPPIPIGSACNDGQQSAGIAVPNGLHNPVGRFTMQGDNPSCTDPLGDSVTYTFNPNAPNSGFATVSNNMPVIFLRPADFQSFSPPVARFLLAHECGHHALGQVLAAFYYHVRLGPREELAADCFAANRLRSLGRLSDSEFNEVLSFIRNVPGDVANLPGPQRAQRIINCTK
jgi:hypothetical protein